jgi:hypothetical protein
MWPGSCNGWQAGWDVQSAVPSEVTGQEKAQGCPMGASEQPARPESATKNHTESKLERTFCLLSVGNTRIWTPTTTRLG